MSARILIADDDSDIRSVIRFTLEKAGMTVEEAADGAAAVAAFRAGQPDLIVLDVGMPELDGLDVCREIRKTSDVPVLFLSARDEEIDRILGLEIGGDDYVTKPFSPRELAVRVKTILKRANGRVEDTASANALLVHGSLELDVDAHMARFAGRPLTLTALEFSILRNLAEGRMRVFSRERLMDVAWPVNVHVSDRTIDSHVRNLRAKLAAAGCRSAVETVHGVGFRIGPCRPD